MVTAPTAVNPAYYVPPVSYGDSAFGQVSGNAANSNNAVDARTSFEQLVALRGEEAALGSRASADTADAALLDSATLVTLSPQALNILNGINGGSAPQQAKANAGVTPAVEGTVATGSTNAVNQGADNAAVAAVVDTATLTGTAPLTSAQLLQIAGVVSQFATQPLTPATVSQIQSALVAQGFNPAQISLEDILVSMNYIGLSPVASFDNQAINDTTLTDELIAA